MSDISRNCVVQRINHIVWISSLRDDEIGLSNRIVEDVETGARKIGLGFTRVTAQGAKSLYALLSDLVVSVSAGMRPIVHFDTHGSLEDGLHFPEKADSAPWLNVCERLSPINKAMKHDLFVVSTACCGLQMISGAELIKPAPFSCLIAPPHDLTAGSIEATIPIFYLELFETLNISDSYEHRLKENFNLITAESLFIAIMARYLNDYCSRTARLKRSELLLTKAIQQGGMINRNQWRKARSFFKHRLRFRESVLLQYSKIFLGDEGRISDAMNRVQYAASKRREYVRLRSMLNRHAP